MFQLSSSGKMVSMHVRLSSRMTTVRQTSTETESRQMLVRVGLVSMVQKGVCVWYASLCAYSRGILGGRGEGTERKRER